MAKFKSGNDLWCFWDQPQGCVPFTDSDASPCVHDQGHAVEMGRAGNCPGPLGPVGVRTPGSHDRGTAEVTSKGHAPAVFITKAAPTFQDIWKYALRQGKHILKRSGHTKNAKDTRALA